MTSVEAKREEFRQYLEKSGVVEALTTALIKLYEETSKPECAVKYVRNRMCEKCPTDEQYDELMKNFESANMEIDELSKKLRSLTGNMKRTTSEIQFTLESGMTELEDDEECKSLLKKHLTREIFDQLKDVKTSFGSTLLDCIQSGLENHDSGCGIYAPDSDAYTDFAAIFDPIIEDYHVGFGSGSVHPQFEWGDPAVLHNLDPENKYIVSTRVRCGRSLEGFPFNPKMSEENYGDLMEKMQSILESLEGDFKGKFHPLEGMPKDVQQQLIDDHFLFKEGDRFLQSARASRFWPVGRGIFFNDEKTFLVWVNEEDHLRLISMQPGGDLGLVYQRLVNGVDLITEQCKFSRHERLGWLTFCPTNLGTTIRASVHIRVPKLAAADGKLEEIAAQYNLQVRGTSGEHTEAVGGIYDISNKRRMGLTEFEAVKEMFDGIQAIIQAEIESEADVNV